MASQNITALTDAAGSQTPASLMYLALSPFSSSDDRKTTLNDLFEFYNKNTTTGAFAMQGVTAPAVSGAGTGRIYFDSTSNTFKISQNGGAYANLGNITTTGFTTGRVPYATGANALGDDAGMSYDAATDFLSLGTATGGGVKLAGTNGNVNALASNAPAANRTTYLPDAAPTQGNLWYAATVGATTQTAWTTGLTYDASTRVLTAVSSSNADCGFTANNSNASTAAQAGLFLFSNASTAVLALTGSGYTPAGAIKANQLYLRAAAGIVEQAFIIDDASRRWAWNMNSVEVMALDVTNGLTIGAPSSASTPMTGSVRLYNASGTTTTKLSAGNAAASLNYILPATSPTAGQVLSASAPSGGNVTLSWTTGGGGSATLTSTQVGFGDGSNVLSGNANFTYAVTNGQLDITTAVNATSYMSVTNTSAGNAARAFIGTTSSSATASLYSTGSGFTTAGLITANSSVLDLAAPNAVILGQTSGALIFGMGSSTERARLTDSTFLLSIAPTTGAGLSVPASTVSSGSLVSIAASGTAAASNTKTALLVATSGANATASQTTYGARITNTSTGTTNTNIALDLTASGAATQNTALNVSAGAIIQTSNLAAAFASGPNGATNPTFLLVNNTASAATGLSITSAAAGGNVTLAAISSGSNEGIKIEPKGSGKLVCCVDAFAIDAGTGRTQLYNNAVFGWSSSGGASGTLDLLLRRAGAASLAFGAADAATAVGQTLSVQSVASGNTNISGATWTLQASLGTSQGAPGRHSFTGGALISASGTTQQTAVSRLELGATKVLTNNTLTDLVQATCASNTVVGGVIEYTVEVFNGTDLQVEVGCVSYMSTNKGGTFSGSSTTKFGNQQNASSGTLTVSFNITAANPGVVQVNANSSLTPSTGYPRITYAIKNLTQQAISVQ